MDLLIDERKKEKANSNTGKFSENGEIEILRKIAEHKPLSFVLLDPTGFMLQISSRKIEYGKRNFSTHICSCSRWVTEQRSWPLAKAQACGQTNDVVVKL